MSTFTSSLSERSITHLDLNQSHPYQNHPSGRFAPTPTGNLHIGNLSTALLAHLDAIHHQHTMLLRIDDIELRPTTDDYIDSQLQDLTWMELTYKSPYLRQSQRTPLYEQAIHLLNQKGLLYPCYCSRKEVALFAPHAQDEGHVYPRICRPSKPLPLDLDHLPNKKGRAPTLRLNLQHARTLLGLSDSLSFIDQCQGPQSFHLEHEVGDFIVRRRDGLHAYQLTCALDDYQLGCARIIRGKDLLISTIRQILILRLLGLNKEHLPQYAHVGLIMDQEGNRLSKRDQSLQISHLCKSGSTPKEVRQKLSQMWWGVAVETWEDCLEAFAHHGLPSHSLIWT